MLKLITSLLFFAACCFGDATYTVGAGQSYSTHTLALAAIPTNLAGQGVQWVAPIAGTYGEDWPAALTIGFTNESAANYIKLEPQAGHEHNGIAGAGVVLSLPPIKSLYLNSEYMRVTNIQTNTNIDNYSVIVQSANITIRNHMNKNTAVPPALWQNGFRAKAANTKFISSSSWSTAGSGTSYNNAGFSFSSGATGSFALNCVSYNHKHGFRNESADIAYCKNCVSMKASGLGGNDFEGTWSSGSNVTNASSDGTATGSGSLTSVADFGFVSLATGNFHILTTSVLKSAGTDISGSFTTDIDNQTITTWMIGTDFFFVAPTATGNSGRGRGQGRGRLLFLR